MYCYNCGQRLNNSILTCPYCNNLFDQNKLDEVLFNRTIDAISEKCTVIPNPYKKSFYLAEAEIVLENEMYLYGYIPSPRIKSVNSFI